MKKYINLFYALSIVGCLLFSTIFALFRVNPYWPHIFQQRKLAENLGVQMNDYAASYAFPVGYFHEILKPGMTLEEIHKLVKGYASVYSCGYSEVYYYFSKNDSRAIRFEINYDQPSAGVYVFLSLQTEDDNSHSIHMHACKLGPLAIIDFPIKWLTRN